MSTLIYIARDGLVSVETAPEPKRTKIIRQLKYPLDTFDFSEIDSLQRTITIVAREYLLVHNWKDIFIFEEQ